VKIDADTIAAVATAPGRGGIGIVRLSGARAFAIAETISGIPAERLQPRVVQYATFRDGRGEAIDEGLLLPFRAPSSFTGEDVVELQGHGGPVVMDLLLAACLALGARLARPGEFSERAFLNDKLDLAQAEAIADLIDARSAAAARGAVRSLQGVFSDCISRLTEALVHLRIYVEASIDFPEEEVDFLADGQVSAMLSTLEGDLDELLRQTRTATLLREGISVVIAGKPNAGKSSLLNALVGREAAIVTPIAGTTRDLLREQLAIDGIPVNIIDTAGLRDSIDPVEQEGIRRALSGLAPGTVHDTPIPTVAVSALTGAGMNALREHLKHVVGYQGISGGDFSARRRHLDALDRTEAALFAGAVQLREFAAGELLAEHLRLAQHSLGEITGEFSADDLLGRIFTSFCIGK
jgi:tRNA modification GTPase